VGLTENQLAARARRLARRVGGQVFSETRAAALVRVFSDRILADRGGEAVFFLTINDTSLSALGNSDKRNRA